MTSIAFPDNYVPPVTGISDYLRFLPGKTYFRILSSPLIGYKYWQHKPTDGKDVPVRTKEKLKDSELIFPATNKFGVVSYSREFYAFKIYAYDDNTRKSGSIKVLDIDTNTIKQQIRSFIMSQDHKSIDNYDLVMERTGEKKATLYLLSRLDSSDKSDDIIEAEKTTPVNLDALFYNKDPFKEESLIYKARETFGESKVSIVDVPF